MATIELLEQIEKLEAENARLWAALEYVKTVWDRWYPPDIFTGESGDEGPLTAVDVRKAINDALDGHDPLHNELEVLRDVLHDKDEWARIWKQSAKRCRKWAKHYFEIIQRQRRTIRRLVQYLADAFAGYETSGIERSLNDLGLTWDDAIDETDE